MECAQFIDDLAYRTTRLIVASDLLSSGPPDWQTVKLLYAGFFLLFAK